MKYKSELNRRNLFKKKQSVEARLVACAIISAFLFLLNFQFPIIYKQFLHYANFLNVAIEFVPKKYSSFLDFFLREISKDSSLKIKNSDMAKEQAIANSKLSRVNWLESENKNLNDLLHASRLVDGKFTTANVISSIDEAFSNKSVKIDKGTSDGIYVGQPVISSEGVFGQVTSVYPLSSTVSVVGSSKIVIPVSSVVNGIKSVAFGNDVIGKLFIKNIPENVVVDIGDLFVTSGIDLKYPPGYPVGIVIKKEIAEDKHFYYVVLDSVANVSHNDKVLLLWNSGG